MTRFINSFDGAKEVIDNSYTYYTNPKMEAAGHVLCVCVRQDNKLYMQVMRNRRVEQGLLHGEEHELPLTGLSNMCDFFDYQS